MKELSVKAPAPGADRIIRQSGGISELPSYHRLHSTRYYLLFAAVCGHKAACWVFGAPVDSRQCVPGAIVDEHGLKQEASMPCPGTGCTDSAAASGAAAACTQESNAVLPYSSVCSAAADQGWLQLACLTIQHVNAPV